MPGNEQLEEQHHADNLQRFEQLEATNAVLVTQQEVLAAQQEAANATMTKLAADVHALKGNMAGNTSLTREALEGIDSLKAMFAQLDIPSLKDMAETMVAMRGGVQVLGWLERPAKWVAAIAGAAAALYALWKIK